MVLRLGRPPASKLLAQWLEASGAEQVQVTSSAAWVDPEGTAVLRVVADPAQVCRVLSGRLRAGARTPWAARWRRAEEHAQAAIDEVLADADRPTEPGLARALVAAVPDGATLVSSSSMPVRDVEWYAAPRDGVRHLANRGANGIDGVVSTAVGVALASAAPTFLLIGDIALLHDSNGLLTLGRRAADLTIVVADNDGGGIFSFLPQATEVEADRFEQLFGTPHGVDPVALATAHGLPAAELTELAGLSDALGAGPAPAAGAHGPGRQRRSCTAPSTRPSPAPSAESRPAGPAEGAGIELPLAGTLLSRVRDGRSLLGRRGERSPCARRGA